MIYCRYTWATLILASVCFPLSLLFFPHASFSIDWNIHRWVVGYHGEYFGCHYHPPGLINTLTGLGLPLPVFYGFLFYPLLGLLSAALGPDISVRIGVLALWLLQSVMVLTVIRRITQSLPLALFVACLVNFAIYPLTNLYNRGDIPEVFAANALTIAVCAWFELLAAPDFRRKVCYGVLLGFAMTFIVGTHPITAVLGSGIFLILALITGPSLVSPRDQRAPRFKCALLLALLAIGAVAVVSPWLIAYRTFSADLGIKRSLQFLRYPELDTFTTRFAPFPLDQRSLTGGLQVSTPYLDAQINMPLLVFVIYMMIVVLGRKAPPRLPWKETLLLIVSSLLFLYTAVISIDPLGNTLFPRFLGFIQFRYRTITYQNLFLLMAAFALLGTYASHPSEKDVRFGFALKSGCLVVAALGVLIKLTHGGSVMAVTRPSSVGGSAESGREFLSLPREYYSIKDFLVVTVGRRMLPEETAIARDVIIPVRDGDNFGLPGTVNIDFDVATPCVTNIFAFPWNRILLDGRLVPPSDIMVKDGIYLGLAIPAGKHAISMGVVPEYLWEQARLISLRVFVLYCAASGLAVFWLLTSAKPDVLPTATAKVVHLSKAE